MSDRAEDGSWCSQCGQPYSERACGPTHAILAMQAKLGAEILGRIEPDPSSGVSR